MNSYGNQCMLPVCSRMFLAYRNVARNTILFITLAVLSLPSCSVINRAKNAYTNSSGLPSLEVPPDLNDPEWNESLEIPGQNDGRVSAVATTQKEKAAVLPEFLDMRIHREANIRWLEVDADPVSLWPALREFWVNNGYEISEDTPLLGTLETEWADRKLENLTNSEASTASALNEAPDTSLLFRDKFRMRLEREPNAVTNIFLTHRGVQSQGLDEEGRIIWTPQNPDPEIEAELLTLLLEHLGASRQEAVAEVQSPLETRLAIELRYLEELPVLLVGEDFSSVWRRTGAALDRSGLVVVDEDRSLGVYYVNKGETVAEFDEPGEDAATVDAARKSSSSTLAKVKPSYQVHLLPQGRQTLITAHTNTDTSLSNDQARDILKRILAAYNIKEAGG